jgi:hypothetical protein
MSKWKQEKQLWARGEACSRRQMLIWQKRVSR